MTIICVLALLFATPAFAHAFPKLTGRVVDQAHILSPAQVAELTRKSEALEAQSGRQFVVATVPSLQGYPIEDYGYRLGRAWGIGQKGEDNGVILLVAPKEHKVRIEVGYGATAFVTDAVSSLIIQNAILPKFRKGDLAGGIMAGADAVIQQMSLPPNQAKARIAAAEQQQAKQKHASPGVLPVIFWIIVIGFMIFAMGRGARGRRYRRRGGGISPWIVLWGLSELGHARGRGGWGGGGFGGGGFGGGGFGGGGGSFGGGGASGSW